MQPVYIVLVAVAAAVLAAFLVVILTRQGSSATTSSEETSARLSRLETELSAAREVRSDLERRLAVEEQKSSRTPELERIIAEKTGLIDTLGAAKTVVETNLATANEGLSRVEASLQEAKDRLATTEKARDETIGRLNARVDTLVNEKGELESAIAEKSALLSEKTEAVGKLNAHLGQATIALEGAQQDAGRLRTELATLHETLDQERRQAGEKLALLVDARDRMTQEFKILAEDVMKTHGETFSKQNKEQIDVILTPLREKLGEFQQGIQVAQTESTRERATLAEQIRQLTESSVRMSIETLNLTRALKGEAQIQGAWGEMILESILERSGLREGEEYTIQESHATDTGKKVRSDVIVNLPGGQRIVIDSKVSLVAFDAHVSAETAADRASTLTRHLASMRSHIKTLASKDYHAAAGSQLDYVMMFVPIEGALAAAINQDGNLTAYAVENNVTIATPTTLMIALRTVANVWQVERRNRNAEAIAARAGLLYDKMVGFVEDMGTLGTRLNQARGSYDEAMGKLSSGRGNLLHQVDQLKGLGARTNKTLPAALLDDREVEMVSAPEVSGVQA